MGTMGPVLWILSTMILTCPALIPTRVLKPAHIGHVCSTWGNFHFKTFDGNMYQFPGTCNYVFASHCKSNYEDFNIQIRRSSATHRATLSNVVMKIEGLVIELKKGAVNVSGGRVTLPYSQFGVHIQRSSAYVKVTAKLGLVLTWNEDDALLLTLQPKYADSTCGLCGNMNNVLQDEFIINNIQLSPLQFGNLQKLDGPTEQCEDVLPDVPKNCSELRETCSRMLANVAFADCELRVPVDSFVDSCTLDLCNCQDSLDVYCICDTLAEYSRQCAHAGGKPLDWRGHKICERSCPMNMKYDECGSPCVDTCSNPERALVCEEHCVDGCFCPPGTVLDDIGNKGCVPLSECSCTYNNKNYAPGESYSSKCRNCTCIGGQWSCQALPCPGYCSLQGGSHIYTYDGGHYNFHGDCSYIFTKDCARNMFTVLTELRRCGVSETETCLKSIILSLDKGHTVLTVKSSGTVLLNGIYAQIPLATDDIVVFQPSSFYLIIQSFSGLQIQVQINPIMQIFLSLDPEYRGDTCGLCGDFNNIRTDDFLSISGALEGTAVAFANSWRSQADCDNVKESYENPCSLSVENERYAKQWCSLLSDTKGPFAPCHGAVNPKVYQKNCMYDSCNYENSEDSVCAALSSYVQACAIEGVILTGWRQTVCDKYTSNCPKNTSYQYSIRTCQLTCRSLSEPDPTCSIRFPPLDGCGCPVGTFLDDRGSCVPAKDCPCYYKGSPMPPGEVIYDNGAMCTCQSGRLHCVGNTPSFAECPGNMVYFDCAKAALGTKGAECQKSCQTVDMECFSIQCASGCICPDGLVLNNNGTCVPVEQCPCVYDGEIYHRGDTIQQDCNTCTCKDRKWQCTKKACQRTCVVYGEGHYKTFDGKRFDFSGDCEYTLTQDYCASNTVNGSFRVISENIPCGTTGATCSKAIKVFLGNFELILSEGGFDVVERDIGSEVPYQIRQMGIYLVIEARNGLIVMWDKKTSILIKLSPEFKGHVCGLCGNYDGSVENEYTTRSQSVVVDVQEFGNSWKDSPNCPDALPLRDPCVANPYRQTWAQKHCSIIISSVFSKCQSKVDPTPYYEACVRDTCACDSGGDCECYCTAVAAYATACNDAGICIAWRTPEICPLFCDYYNPEGECEWHYKPCGAPCMKTCRNPSGQCMNQLTGLEGCYPQCPKDRPFFDEDIMKCVAQAKCGCYDDDGKRYNVGDMVPSFKNCESCICTKKGRRCQMDLRACYCYYGNMKYNYGDVIYNTTDGIGGCITATCSSNGTINRSVKPCVTTTLAPSTTFHFDTTTSPLVNLSTAEPVSLTSVSCLKEICKWSVWYDVTCPKYGENEGDFETFENIREKGHSVCKVPSQVECRAQKFPKIPVEDLGQVIQCNASVGLVCQNRDQFSKLCFNYEIRILCCSYVPCAESTKFPTSTSRTYSTPISVTTRSPKTTQSATVSSLHISSTASSHSFESKSTLHKTTSQKTTEEAGEASTQTPPTTSVPKSHTTTHTTPCKTRRCTWTPWYDVHFPSIVTSDGDFETLENIKAAGNDICQIPEDIECRAERFPSKNIEDIGQVVSCNVTYGLICHNKDQDWNFPLCYNYQVRVLCCSMEDCESSSTPAYTTASGQTSRIPEETSLLTSTALLSTLTKTSVSTTGRQSPTTTKRAQTSSSPKLSTHFQKSTTESSSEEETTSKKPFSMKTTKQSELTSTKVTTPSKMISTKKVSPELTTRFQKSTTESSSEEEITSKKPISMKTTKVFTTPAGVTSTKATTPSKMISTKKVSPELTTRFQKSTTESSSEEETTSKKPISMKTTKVFTTPAGVTSTKATTPSKMISTKEVSTELTTRFQKSTTESSSEEETTSKKPISMKTTKVFTTPAGVTSTKATTPSKMISTKKVSPELTTRFQKSTTESSSEEETTSKKPISMKTTKVFTTPAGVTSTKATTPSKMISTKEVSTELTTRFQKSTTESSSEEETTSKKPISLKTTKVFTTPVGVTSTKATTPSKMISTKEVSPELTTRFQKSTTESSSEEETTSKKPISMKTTKVFTTPAGVTSTKATTPSKMISTKEVPTEITTRFQKSTTKSSSEEETTSKKPISMKTTKVFTTPAGVTSTKATTPSKMISTKEVSTELTTRFQKSTTESSSEEETTSKKPISLKTTKVFTTPAGVTSTKATTPSKMISTKEVSPELTTRFQKSTTESSSEEETTSKKPVSMKTTKQSELTSTKVTTPTKMISTKEVSPELTTRFQKSTTESSSEEETTSKKPISMKTTKVFTMSGEITSMKVITPTKMISTKEVSPELTTRFQKSTTESSSEEETTSKKPISLKTTKVFTMPGEVTSTKATTPSKMISTKEVSPELTTRLQKSTTESSSEEETTSKKPISLKTTKVFTMPGEITSIKVITPTKMISTKEVSPELTTRFQKPTTESSSEEETTSKKPVSMKTTKLGEVTSTMVTIPTKMISTKEVSPELTTRFQKSTTESSSEEETTSKKPVSMKTTKQSELISTKVTTPTKMISTNEVSPKLTTRFQKSTTESSSEEETTSKKPLSLKTTKVFTMPGEVTSTKVITPTKMISTKEVSPELTTRFQKSTTESSSEEETTSKKPISMKTTKVFTTPAGVTSTKATTPSKIISTKEVSPELTTRFQKSTTESSSEEETTSKKPVSMKTTKVFTMPGEVTSTKVITPTKMISTKEVSPELTTRFQKSTTESSSEEETTSKKPISMKTTKVFTMPGEVTSTKATTPNKMISTKEVSPELTTRFQKPTTESSSEEETTSKKPVSMKTTKLGEVTSTKVTIPTKMISTKEVSPELTTRFQKSTTESSSEEETTSKKPVSMKTTKQSELISTKVTTPTKMISTKEVSPELTTRFQKSTTESSSEEETTSKKPISMKTTKVFTTPAGVTSTKATTPSKIISTKEVSPELTTRFQKSTTESSSEEETTSKKPISLKTTKVFTMPGEITSTKVTTPSKMISTKEVSPELTTRFQKSTTESSSEEETTSKKPVSMKTTKQGELISTKVTTPSKMISTKEVSPELTTRFQKSTTESSSEEETTSKNPLSLKTTKVFTMPGEVTSTKATTPSKMISTKVVTPELTTRFQKSTTESSSEEETTSKKPLSLKTTKVFTMPGEETSTKATTPSKMISTKEVTPELTTRFQKSTTESSSEEETTSKKPISMKTTKVSTTSTKATTPNKIITSKEGSSKLTTLFYKSTTESSHEKETTSQKPGSMKTTEMSTASIECELVCQWSQWFDVSFPTQETNGDFETFENIRNSGFNICDEPSDIQCRSADLPDIALEDLQQNVQCNVTNGLVCRAEEQEGPFAYCYNYEIRIFCCSKCASTLIPPSSAVYPTSTISVTPFSQISSTTGKSTSKLSLKTTKVHTPGIEIITTEESSSSGEEPTSVVSSVTSGKATSAYKPPTDRMRTTKSTSSNLSTDLRKSTTKSENEAATSEKTLSTTKISTAFHGMTSHYQTTSNEAVSRLTESAHLKSTSQKPSSTRLSATTGKVTSAYKTNREETTSQKPTLTETTEESSASGEEPSTAISEVTSAFKTTRRLVITTTSPKPISVRTTQVSTAFGEITSTKATTPHKMSSTKEESSELSTRFLKSTTESSHEKTTSQKHISMKTTKVPTASGEVTVTKSTNPTKELSSKLTTESSHEEETTPIKPISTKTTKVSSSPGKVTSSKPDITSHKSTTMPTSRVTVFAKSTTGSSSEELHSYTPLSTKTSKVLTAAIEVSTTKVSSGEEPSTETLSPTSGKVSSAFKTTPSLIRTTATSSKLSSAFYKSTSEKTSSAKTTKVSTVSHDMSSSYKTTSNKMSTKKETSTRLNTSNFKSTSLKPISTKTTKVSTASGEKTVTYSKMSTTKTTSKRLSTSYKTPTISSSSEEFSSRQTPQTKAGTTKSTSGKTSTTGKQESAISRTSQPATTARNTFFTTKCRCNVNGVLIPPGQVLYNTTDNAGWCFYARCNDTCQVERYSEQCHSSVAPTIASSTKTAKTITASKATVTSKTTKSSTKPDKSTKTSQTQTSASGASSTPTPSYECSAVMPPRKINETWMIDKCTMASCIGGNNIAINKVQCPPIKEVVCANRMQPKKIYDESGCCYQNQCECVCGGWGTSHYITFDGTYYNFDGQCTYILVQQITPRFDHFRVYIDNFSCDPDDPTCIKTLRIAYKSDTVVLVSQKVLNRPQSKIYFNDERVYPAFTKNAIKITYNGIFAIVEIPELEAYISFNVLSFTIKLPYNKFLGNTEGHCGKCSNNQVDDCILPSGQLAPTCVQMAGQWNDPNQDPSSCSAISTLAPFTTAGSTFPLSSLPYFSTLLSSLPSTLSSSAPATELSLLPSTYSSPVQTTQRDEPCNPPDLCKLILSSVFEMCHQAVPPEPFYQSCVMDGCVKQEGDILCSNLQSYALLCAIQGVCVDWRNSTNDTCPNSCPPHKVYKACGAPEEPICNMKYNEIYVDKEQEHFMEGCYCPEGTIKFSTASDQCVTTCGCTGPDGMPREPGETWDSNCQTCLCDNTTMSVQCVEKSCAAPTTTACTEEGSMPVSVPDPANPCCQITECRCDISLCSSVKEACELGYEAMPEMLSGKCCPVYSCVPKEVCVYNRTEYQPGVTIPSLNSCETCICDAKMDQTKPGLLPVSCSPVLCAIKCAEGYMYQEVPDQCCGTCVQTHCIMDLPDKTTELLKPGETWSPPGDNCTHYECMNRSGELLPVASKISCPKINIDECLEGTMKKDPTGCCLICVQEPKKCQKTKTEKIILQNGCTSVSPVVMSYCKGSCDSSSMYSEEAQTMVKNCGCCQETKTETLTITLKCPSGELRNYSYINVKSCSCMETDCKEDDKQTIKSPKDKDKKESGKPKENKNLSSKNKNKSESRSKEDSSDSEDHSHSGEKWNHNKKKDNSDKRSSESNDSYDKEGKKSLKDKDSLLSLVVGKPKKGNQPDFEDQKKQKGQPTAKSPNQKDSSSEEKRTIKSNTNESGKQPENGKSKSLIQSLKDTVKTVQKTAEETVKNAQKSISNISEDLKVKKDGKKN